MSLLLKDLLSLAAVMLCIEATRFGPPSKSPRMTMFYVPTSGNNDENARRMAAKVLEIGRCFGEVSPPHDRAALLVSRLNESLHALCRELSGFVVESGDQHILLGSTLAELSDYAGVWSCGERPSCSSLIQCLEPEGSPRQIILASLAGGRHAPPEGVVGRAFQYLHPITQASINLADLIEALRRVAVSVN